jgi:hypothetical protein
MHGRDICIVLLIPSLIKFNSSIDMADSLKFVKSLVCRNLTDNGLEVDYNAVLDQFDPETILTPGRNGKDKDDTRNFKELTIAYKAPMGR